MEKGPSDDIAKRRVRDSVLSALRDELAVQPGLFGPWSMLEHGTGVWDTGLQVNPELYMDMRGRLHPTSIKEVLLAAAGVKVARVSVSDGELPFLRTLAERYGFCLTSSRERYLPLRDLGKGNYCNAFERLATSDEPGGLRSVYIANDESLAATANLLEEAGHDDLFGTLLGIPHCCRSGYERFQAEARTKQFDLIPFVLENTPDGVVCDAWINYPAIYFGRTLISFFPCSFRCAAAHTIATTTYRMLADCDGAWARSFLELQSSNILYTEYQGVHLFREPLENGSIRYGPGGVLSTEPTEVAGMLANGDRVEVRGKRRVDVYSGNSHLGTVQGEDVSMCVFLARDYKRD